MKPDLKKAYIALFIILSSLVARAQDLPAAPDSTARLRAPMDTLDTHDKYTRVILFDDNTWVFLDLGHPKIDTAALYDEYWTTSEIHAYRLYPADQIPDEIDLLLADSLNHYCPPIQGKVFSGYKVRRGSSHQGTDIPLNVGDTVRAAFDGVVRYVGTTKQTGGYGNLVVLRHSNGLETYYGHLSKTLCEPNEAVKAGDVIGLGGSTGRSTGPHLHFETRYKGQTFDAERVIDFETGALRDSVLTLKKHYYSIYSHYGQTEEESQAASDRIVHTIRSGDTLSGLARKYGTTVSAICKLNNISANKTLRIGEHIIVR
ncbi:MAG: peptidoglycan DD-metalloendopeptidase family protein [Bacteroidales bacterium]|nr:peptidoglycan DD-metalloendopeptidase family protein [Bacteroidales bacterium]